MRILILSQHFPPEPIDRLKDLTAHLVKKGHEVSVVTTFPSYPVGRIYPGYPLRLLARYHDMGARVTRVFAMPYRGLLKSMRMLSYFSFALAALLLGLLPKRRPDVAYVYHPPLTTGLAASIYNLVTRVPFVYDVQDLWPDAIVAAGMMRENSRAYRSLRTMEDFVYKRARHITVLSNGMRNNLVGKGVPHRKISVISNWGNPEVYKPIDANVLRQSLGWADRFVVMLAGNMGLTHGLETVIETAEYLRDDPAILFVFLGSGAAKSALLAKTEACGLNNVQFLNQVPEEEAALLVNAADAMLVHLPSKAGGEFSVPHRIFSYMLCAKPIIAAATGSTADLIASHNCGWVCPPSDKMALGDTVRQAAADLECCKQLGQNGLKAGEGSFSREFLLDRIEEVITRASRV